MTSRDEVLRLGPTFLKNSARKKPWWSVMNWVTWGPMAVAMKQDDQHVRQGVDNVHDALHDTSTVPPKKPEMEP